MSNNATMQFDAENIKKGIANASVYLIEHNLATEGEIRRIIRTAIIDTFRDERCTPVLLNCAHGQFNLSTSFIEFATSVGLLDNNEHMCTYSIPERIEYAKIISDYGAHISKIYPMVYKHVNTYTQLYPKLIDIINLGSNILSTKAKLQKLENRYVYIKEFIKDVSNFSNNDKRFSPSVSILKNENLDLSLYSRDELVLFIENVDIEEVRKELENDLARKVRNPNWERLPEYLKDMIIEFHEKYQNIIHNNTNKTLPEDHNLDFSQSVKVSSEEDMTIWRTQNKCIPHVMMFLSYCWLNHQDLYDQIVNDLKYPGANVSDDRVHQILGLMFAAGPYCTLYIQDVVPHIHFEIDEYEGRESLRF